MMKNDLEKENARLIDALEKIRAILNRRDRNELENEAFHEANRALIPMDGQPPRFTRSENG